MILFRLIKPQVYKYAQLYERLQWMTRQEIRAYQFSRLKELLEYAYKNVPFYREFWDSYGIDPVVDSLEDLKKFPVVSKSMLQEAIKSGKISREYIGKLNSREISWQSTTGSSGEPFRFPVDLNSSNHKEGVRRRVYRWYGLDYGVKWARFWRGEYRKTFRDKIKEWLIGEYRFCIYDPKYPLETRLTPERIIYFIDELNKIKPEIIDGFVSSLRDISLCILENDISLDFKPRAIVTGAEMLTDNDRKLISKAFGSVVFNRYGGTESSIIAHECEYQAKSETHYLHIQEDRLIVEVDENNELIFTDLSNRAIPFIRYRNGDIVTVDNSYDCPCGRKFSVITSIQGRVNDMFILPGGGKVTSHLFQHYMKKCEGIAKYQMIQESLDLIVVNWVKNRNLFKEEEFRYVQKLIAEALKGCKVIWNEVKDIEVGPGGKFRQHICKL